MIIYIKPAGMKEKIRVEVDQELLVEELKNKLLESPGTDGDQHRLTYDGKTMESGRSLSDYNVQDGSILHLTPRLLGGGRPHFFLHVITPVGNSIDIDVSKSHSIAEVKKRIVDEIRELRKTETVEREMKDLDLKVQRYRLFVKEEEMQDSKTLEEYDIISEAVIRLEIDDAKSCTVF